MVDGGVGSRRCRGQAARLNDGGAALADGGQEDSGVPDLVVDQVFDLFAADGGKTVVRVHGRRVVAPDGEFFDVGDLGAGLGSDLRQGTVVVQAQHGGEVFAWQVRRAFHGDVSVGVGGVTDHQHLDVAAGDSVQGLALGGEDLTVDGQQFSALHAGFAGHGTDQQCVVGVLEGGHRVAVGFHADQQGKGAVFEFHHDALERLLRAFNRHFEQLQNNRLVLAQHFAGGDAEQQGVTNLTGGTSDGNTDGFFAHDETPGRLLISSGHAL